MALSFYAVQKAHVVFNTLQKEFGIPASVPSFPDDMEDWDEDNSLKPPVEIVLGFGKKSDGGWESLCFFLEEPPQELIKRFEELKRVVPHTSMNRQYQKNNRYWIIGWF